MSNAGPARLTSFLLARKGEAVPATFSEHGRFGGPASFVRPAAVDESPVAVKPVYQPEDAPLAVVPAAHQIEFRDAQHSNDHTRIRMTVRTNPDLHLKVKMSAQHLHRSMNDLVTEAVARYLDQLGPEVLVNDWVRATLLNGRSTS